MQAKAQEVMGTDSSSMLQQLKTVLIGSTLRQSYGWIVACLLFFVPAIYNIALHALAIIGLVYVLTSESIQVKMIQLYIYLRDQFSMQQEPSKTPTIGTQTQKEKD